MVKKGHSKPEKSVWKEKKKKKKEKKDEQEELKII